jgi:hypothetical protein
LKYWLNLLHAQKRDIRDSSYKLPTKVLILGNVFHDVHHESLFKYTPCTSLLKKIDSTLEFLKDEEWPDIELPSKISFVDLASVISTTPGPNISPASGSLPESSSEPEATRKDHCVLDEGQNYPDIFSFKSFRSAFAKIVNETLNRGSEHLLGR